MPFETTLMNRLELLNISVTLFSCYFLLTFTPFVSSNRVRYNISWVLISVIALAIAVNIIFFLKENRKAFLQYLKNKYFKLKTCLRLKRKQN